MRTAFSLVTVCSLVFLTSCRFYDNFTTYFNTYYNSKRIMRDIEDEFAYSDEAKRVKPRVLVAEKTTLAPEVAYNRDLPPFLLEMSIPPEKLQPVRTKVDSIIEKGSKIIANHPKSNYIDGTLFLMTKAYFYKGEWLAGQIKAQELVDNYPYGDFSSVGHLWLAKTYMMQKRYAQGEITLSRTVDVAWGQKDYETLSEVFRLLAELALHNGDVEGAIKPYRRAIAQSDDDEMRARWQTDLGAVLFRNQYFAAAEKEFAQTFDYSPDVLTQFEAKLYRGAALAQLGKYDSAEKLFNELQENENFKEWRGWISAERINVIRLELREADEKTAKLKDKDMKAAEKTADSAYIGNPAVSVAMYQRGLDFFKKGNYTSARQYFASSRSVNSPVKNSSIRYSNLLNAWETKTMFALPLVPRILEKGEGTDSLRADVAGALFEVGRIHEQLGNQDSSIGYYGTAVRICPTANPSRARYLYAHARTLRTQHPKQADSLMEEIALKYATTEYGFSARRQLGYTEAAVIDTVGEMFSSGDRFRSVGDYSGAIRQFTRLVERYPDSLIAPKALYVTGWIWERNLKNNDSALAVYKRLIDRYPQSPFAKEVRPSVLWAMGVRTGQMPADSSLFPKPKPDTKSEKGEPVQPNQLDLTVPKRGSVQPNMDFAPNIQNPIQPPPQNTPPPDEKKKPEQVKKPD